MEEFKYIGKKVLRIEGREKITASAQFVDDIDFGPGLLYAAIVESPYAHAIIKKIDTKRALKHDQVVKVVTGFDFPFRFGLYMHDRYIFAQRKVRFVGEQVAAVIAKTPSAALEGAKLVKVTYQELRPILDVNDALTCKQSELIHTNLKDYTHVPWFFPKANTNIAHFRKIRRGDSEEAFEKSFLVLEDEYQVPRYAHCAIETHGTVGLCDHSGRLTVWTASQSPCAQRYSFAESLAPLGFSHKDIRVITPYVGGGFGGKAGVSMEIMGAALATAVRGRPVKVLWSRDQEFYNTYQRQGLLAKIKMGAARDGKIQALDYQMIWDAGAYVEYGANVVNAAGLSASGPYKIDNLKIDSQCIYTNLPPGGPYRGFGYSEFLFGLESHLNHMAQKLEIDPLKFRKINAIREGDLLSYGKEMHPNGLMEAILRVEKEIEWDKKIESKNPDKVYGKGIALFWKAPAMPPNASSSAIIKFNEDASINILVSGMEIGQGYKTVMAQIAGEVLGIAIDKIRVESPDTDRNPYEWQTVASHVTWSCGNAVLRAAEDIRGQMFELIARALHKDIDFLYLEEGAVKSKEDENWSLLFSDFVISGIMMQDGTFRGGPLIGRGTFMPENCSAISDPETGQGGKPNVHYTLGAQALILEIDKKTFEMKVPKVVLAIDAGKAINPDLVRGQITGGVVQGLSTVFYEEMCFSAKGRLLNANFTDYKIPTSMDIPSKIVPIIVEVPQSDGPFGARGVGEHTMIPAAPCVAGAIFEALGVKIKSMPITKNKLYNNLK